MSGRGRELTLPAWMTAEKKQPLPLPNAITDTTTAPAVSNMSLAANNPTFPQASTSSNSVHHTNFQHPHTIIPLNYGGHQPFVAVQPTFFPVSKPLPPSTPAPSTIGDPNNDATLWSGYKSEDGRKYWFNRVSLVSTYDKPFCLKSPEERSIPPCSWKEYVSDGKKYYSNGVESR